MLRQQDAVHLEARPGRRQRSVPRCYGCCSAGRVGGYNSGRLSFTQPPGGNLVHLCALAVINSAPPPIRSLSDRRLGANQLPRLTRTPLAEPSPNPRRDWARPCHICARTGQAQMTLLIRPSFVLQPIRTALESAVIGDATEAARQMRLEWVESFQRRRASRSRPAPAVPSRAWAPPLPRLRRGWPALCACASHWKTHV
jgi:hypothetical protein